MVGLQRFVRILALAGLSAAAVWGGRVSASPGSSPFLIRCWQTPDGLPNNSPTSVLQAPDGDLWIASNSGVTRFDGVRFENFDTTDGLPDNQVQCLFADAKGRLWVGTRRGVAVRENGRWRTPGHEWSSVSCVSIAETSDGSMWFATAKGLWRVRAGGAENRSDQPVRELRAAADGSLWIIGFNHISRWADGVLAPEPATGGLVNGREVWGMAPTRDGRWIIYGQNLLVRGAGDRWESIAGGMPDADGKHISCVAAADGSIWVATRNRGISCLKNGVWTQIDTEDGLSHSDVRFLMDDHEGNLWACTHGGGLNQVRHRRIEVFGVKEGLGRHATTALVADAAGQLWAGTDGGGLLRLEGGAFVPAPQKDGRANSFIWSLCQDGGGGLWIGTFQQGLVHWQDGQSRTFDARGKFSKNWIHGMLRDRAGDLWIGTHKGGIFRLRGGDLTVGRAPQEGIPAPVIGFLEKRDGELWAYTSGSGIFQKTGQKWLQPEGELGLPNATVSDMHEDGDGRVWLGLGGTGLALWNGKSYSRWDSGQGLASDSILQILDDSRGNLWLGTNVGLQRVSIEDLLAVDAGSRANLLSANLYSRDEGLTLPQFTVGHGDLTAKTPDGALWFSMAGGAIRVPPGIGDTPKLPLPLRIQAVVVDDRTLWHHEWHVPAALVVKSPGGPVEIHFAAPSFSSPEKLRFRYRLAGLDDSWRDTEGRRVVTFPSLPPGKYRFEVNSARPGGSWEKATAAIRMEIQPTFWQSRWFLGACTALGSIAIAVLARWWSLRRVRRHLAILKQERKLDGERSRIAQDLHDDLGATLTEINFLGVLGASHANSPATRDRLDAIVERARRMAKSLDEIVWTVNPANDSLSSTVNYLCSRAQETLSSADLRCRQGDWLEALDPFQSLGKNRG